MHYVVHGCNSVREEIFVIFACLHATKQIQRTYVFFMLKEEWQAIEESELAEGDGVMRRILSNARDIRQELAKCHSETAPCA